MKSRTILVTALFGAVVLVGGTWTVARWSMGYPAGAHGLFGGGMHDAMMAEHHAATGTAEHDEATMPMLHGADTTPEEVGDLQALFVDHTLLQRSVENLPNGIRTVTETDDEALRAALVGHVVGMLARVEEQRDPQIPIQSPTLDPIFASGPGITTTIEMTDTGIDVIQTSDDPAIVAALQTHAAEVSDLAARGMQSVHEAMMNRP